MECCKAEEQSFLSQDSLYFEDKDVFLYKANALDSTLFASPFTNLIVISPPYNVGLECNAYNDDEPYQEYLEFSKKWMNNCYAWVKTQCRFCLNIPLDKNKGGARKENGASSTISKRATI